MQATIRIKYVNQPREGKKMGSIKGDDGTIIGVYPDKLSLFQQGQTYTVEYDEGEGGFKRLKRIIPGAPNTAPNTNGAPAGDKEAGMFVMAVLGKCFEGTAQLPDRAALTDMVRSLKKAWKDGMTDLPSDPPGVIDDTIPY
jgi:hypothetical protein